MKKIGRGLAITSFTVILLAVLTGYGIRLNKSNSLPQSIFISAPIQLPLVKGQIVSFEHPHLQATLGKILIGFPGDVIAIRDQKVFVNELEIGIYKTVSSSGKLYNPISYTTIPTGYFFVYTPHIESFDSRYSEFGLVNESWIKEVLWPLF